MREWGLNAAQPKLPLVRLDTHRLTAVATAFGDGRFKYPRVAALRERSLPCLSRIVSSPDCAGSHPVSHRPEQRRMPSQQIKICQN